jgi:hypothetical protein
MAAGKEIRTKIKSVENTKKITKAMEMVAAAKMRKAQDRMRTARPYATRWRNIAGHLSLANPEYKHPFVVANDAKKPVGLVAGDDRQGPVRRPEHQHAACRDGQAQGGGGRQQGRGGGHRQQGSWLHEPHRRQSRLARDGSATRRIWTS